jgi:ABC transporter substrate binding protein (PQQ-dependent alcohol dehydrogenase system)
MLAATSALSAGDSLIVKIGYLGRVERMETISLLEQPTSDNGVAGAQLAIEDNNTTGKFLNQSFALEAARLKGSNDPVAAAIQLADRGVSLILLDLPADMLLKIADVGRARGLLLFNVGAADDQLRQEDCRPDVIHVAPSRSMLADGLAQYLVWKRWRRWLLVVGSHDPDKLYADALRRAAGRFGAKIVQERVFQDTGGARRTDSGLVQIQSQIPPFTQSAPDYEVLIAADESQVFASYLPYRTHDPRPVAGSAGLVPTSWHASLDQWGAIQLQDRFRRLFSRRMTALDMQAWTAIRMIGEAAARVNSADSKNVFDYMKGPDFAVAAFKGRKLTVRDWDLQLRQPILLTDGRVIVYPRYRSSGDEMSPQIAFAAGQRCRELSSPRGSPWRWSAQQVHSLPTSRTRRTIRSRLSIRANGKW